MTEHRDEAMMQFPTHKACVPYECGSHWAGECRLVGFVITPGHPWWGQSGLTEPIAALDAAIAAGDAKAEVTEATLRDWFNLVMHAGIDARDGDAKATLFRLQDIAKRISAEIARFEAALAKENSND